MKKCLLVAICMIALAGTSIASAENAGIGFEWNIGPNFPLVPYFSSVTGFNNAFVLSWPVGDMTVGIFGETARTRASRNYTVTDEQVSGATVDTHKYTIIRTGSMTNSGLSLTTFLPGMDFLRLGIEIGTSSLATTDIKEWDNGVDDGGNGSWGDISNSTTIMSPLAGLTARWSLLNSKAKGIWTEIAVTANVRFVPVPDTYPLGTMEAHVPNDSVAPAQTSGFEPMTNFNHANVMLGATIGF